MSVMTDRMARLPWVTRLEQTQDCDGMRWSHMTGKALGNRALFDQYKCKNRARWQFTALRGTGTDTGDGVFCWPHLLVQLRSNPAEDERAARELIRLEVAL